MITTISIMVATSSSRTSNEGSELVYSWVSHTLGANVEHLDLIGTGSINGTGNALDNTMAGNESGNILMGAGGDDDIWGFGGEDTIDGGTGSYGLHGMADDDTITASGNIQNGGFGDDGNDQVFFAGNQNLLFGGTGEDWLGVSGDFNMSSPARPTTIIWRRPATATRSMAGPATTRWRRRPGTAATPSSSTPTTRLDTIIGFSTAGGDIINLESFGLASFAQLQPYMSQAGNDVVIALNGTDILTLQNVQLGALSASHFDLV